MFWKNNHGKKIKLTKNCNKIGNTVPSVLNITLLPKLKGVRFTKVDEIGFKSIEICEGVLAFRSNGATVLFENILEVKEVTCSIAGNIYPEKL